MLYHRHRPPPILRDYVDSFWILQDAPAHARERIVPEGTFELVVNLAENEIHIYDPEHPQPCRRRFGAVVSGAFSRFFVVDTRTHAAMLGVHFRPGGALPFFGIRADEATDRHVDLEALWGTDARGIRERLCEAPTLEGRFAILTDAMLAHRRSDLDLRPDVRLALCRLQERPSGIREIARDLRLSHRRFIEVFAGEVGVNPKLFGRLQRFQRAMAATNHADSPRWGELALDCGYYDQSHLIRDFQAFTGLAPTEYLHWRQIPVKDGHVAVS